MSCVLGWEVEGAYGEFECGDGTAVFEEINDAEGLSMHSSVPPASAL